MTLPFFYLFIDLFIKEKRYKSKKYIKIQMKLGARMHIKFLN